MLELHGEEGENTVIGGRYRILSILGGGAMGNVFLAEDEYLKRQVAIKVLRDEWGGREDVVKRLENECRLMAHLGQHPNIVTLIDRLVVDGKTMLVMEYAVGETLAQILNRTLQIKNATGQSKPSKPRDESLPLIMTPGIAYEVAVQCLTALDYAHSKGVLHLDIKPGNIMIQRDRLGRITAKLMDFGIGRTRVDSNLASAVTALTFTGGAGLGTPAYMAPEQIDPDRFGTPGPTADLYSFGVTYFEMLTLQLPFNGAYTEVLHAHADTRPPNPREINPEIPVSTARVILTALRKSPGNRYHSAGDMLQDLQRSRLKQTASDVSGEEDAVGGKTLLPWWKMMKALSVRTLVLAGILIFAFAYWRLDWEFPLKLDGFMAYFGEGLSVREVRDAAEMARREALAAQAGKNAAEEWKSAEETFNKASAQETTGAEAVRLYLQAQFQYEQAAKLAVQVEGKESSPPAAAEGEPSVQYEDKPEGEGETVAAQEETTGQKDQPESVSSQRDTFESGMLTSVPLGADVSLDLAWISGGAFDFMAETRPEEKRGKGDRAGKGNNKGIKVWLPQGFWIGRFEVTQRQWSTVMGSNPSKFQGDLELPVDSVNWHDCQEFLGRLNKIVPGGGFRLPTEAEWEYAARAGNGLGRHGFAMQDKLSDYAWYSGDSGGQTHPVGAKLPNDWGLHDAVGNVWEWVQDWHSQELPTEGQLTNPTGPSSGVYKVLRGGAWSFYEDQCRLTARTPVEPGVRADTYGFRVARDFVPNAQ